MPITIDLGGRVAWVTGGAGDIGTAIVSMLHRAGATVVALDRSLEGTDGSPPEVVRVGVDVRDVDGVRRVVAGLEARDLSPDLLINNAGIARDAMAWKMSDDEWHEVIDVNLGGAFRMVRACAPAMRRARGGAVVNVTSINGMRGKLGQSNYAASKAGLIGLTKTLARELASAEIRVNAVAPGMIDTVMTRSLPEAVRTRAMQEAVLGRLGRAEDVASAVLYLVSPLAAHVTGQVLVVDGGQLM